MEQLIKTTSNLIFDVINGINNYDVELLKKVSIIPL